MAEKNTNILKYDPLWAEAPKGRLQPMIKRLSVSVKNTVTIDRNKFPTTRSQYCSLYQIDDVLNNWKVRKEDITKAYWGSKQLTF